MSRVNRRAWILLIFFFILGFAVLIVQLFRIQVIEGEFYNTRVRSQQVSSVAIEAKRGGIYDRNEKLLVQSAVVWDVCISPLDIKDKEWEPIATNLSTILEIPKEDILKYKGKETYYGKVKTGIDNSAREKVQEFINSGEKALRSIYFEESPKRYYIYDNLASTLIGFTNDDHHGAYGLESYYDPILAGTPGVKVGASSDGGAKGYKAEDGHSIMLTIDEVVQSSVEKHLEMAIVEHGVKNGAAGIVWNIQTGEILAMASLPDFNPNDPYKLSDPTLLAQLEELTEETPEYKEKQEELWYYQWRNKAISDPYEPGSVYKIVTAAIALEEQKASLGDHFYCSGSIEVAGEDRNCWLLTGHGDQDFTGIMRNSCNPAFVMVGFRNGAKATSDYMSSFGFGKLTGVDLPGEAVGLVHSYETLEGTAGAYLASTSFGQSYTATPLQVIAATSAAVNGGYLVEPYIVRQIMDAQGNVIETIEPKVKRQVISAATSDTVKYMVEQVVENGSGRNAAVPGYRIGGKTGTSEKLDLLPRKEYVLSFVGFAPMENPTYAVLVMLDEPSLTDAYASVIAAPVAGAIMQEILPYLGVEPRFSEEELAKTAVEVPYLIGSKPHDAQAELTALGIKTSIIGQGKSVLRQVPLATEEIMKGGTVMLFCSEEELSDGVIMPDLIGAQKTAAKKTLQDMGLNVKILGDTASKDTFVDSQWPEQGEKLINGDLVSITVKVNESAMETLPRLPDAPEVSSVAVEDEGAISEDGVDIPIETSSQVSSEPEVSKEVSAELDPTPASSTPSKGDGGEVMDG